MPTNMCVSLAVDKGVVKTIWNLAHPSCHLSITNLLDVGKLTAGKASRDLCGTIEKLLVLCCLLFSSPWKVTDRLSHLGFLNSWWGC